MEVAMEKPAASRKKALVKVLILAAFIVGAICLVRFTPIRDYLTAEGLGRFLEQAGLWAPVIFVIIYAVGVCLFLPGTSLTGLGAAIFGPYWGFVAIVILYAFAEGTFANWSIVYLHEERGIALTQASFALSVFWAMIAGGRLLVSALLLKVKAEWIWLTLPL